MALIIARTAPAHAQFILTPTLDSNSNVNTDTGTSTDKLTDSSGLTAPVSTGDTLAQALTASNTAGSGDWYTGQPGGYPANYYASGGSAPRFVWDLGASTDITSIVLWQADGVGNGNQSNEFALRFSQSNTSGFGSAYNNALAADNRDAQVFSFARNARFVEMTILTNYYNGLNPDAGGDRVNLGEVRFGSATPVVVPEVSTIALLLPALALVGTVVVRRRNR